MKKNIIAAILMIIHGGIMELGGCIFALIALATSSGQADIKQYFSFVIPYLNENLILMLFMGAIFGTVRLIGAIGLLKNRMWGFVLSIINCITTMILMIFMLPAGIADGILACSCLILLLTQYFGKQKIIK